MENVFISLVNSSITAGYLVIAVMLLRPLLKNAPKYIRCVLWGFVGLRLVLPFSIESIFSLIPSAEPIPQEILYQAEPTIHTGISFMNSTINPILSESMAPNPGDSVNPLQIVTAIAWNVWLLGVLALVVYALVSYIRLRKNLREAIKEQDNIWLCDRIPSPFLLGIFRPRIYLPSDLPEGDREFVIAHENAHIRRKDHWWKPLGFLLLTVYWFNPLMWVAYIFLCRDIEFACDEKVMNELGSDCKKAYSEALIHCSVSRKMISACPVAFGEEGVKGRIKSVLNYKKPAFWIILISLLVCTAVAVCFLTNPKDTTEPEQNVPSYTFQAEVLEVREDSLLVTPLDGEGMRIADKIVVRFPEGHEETYEVGDRVQIEYDGMVQELYPPIISNVYSILIVEHPSHLQFNDFLYLTDNSNGNLISVQIPIVRTANTQAVNAFIKEQVYHELEHWLLLEECNLSESAAPIENISEKISSSEYSTQFLHISSRITFQTEELVSIVFTGQQNVRTAAHPNNVFFTVNVDVPSIARVGVASFYPIDDVLYDAFLQYVKSDRIDSNELMSLDVLDKSAFLEGLSSEPQNDFYSYFTPTHIGISYPVAYALGNSIQAQIPYSSLSYDKPSDMQESYNELVKVATWDIDKDGIPENIMVSPGPTSGLFSITVTVTENGIPEYRNIFTTEWFQYELRTEPDGSVVLAGMGYDDKEIVMQIGVEDDNIVLSGNADFLYWGSTDSNTLSQVRKNYPQFLNLPIDKGLEVYVWYNGTWRCGVRSGTNRNADISELHAFGNGTTLEEMAIILGTYGIPKEEIAILYSYNPAFSGENPTVPTEQQQAYIEESLSIYLPVRLSVDPYLPPEYPVQNTYPLVICAYKIAENNWRYRFYGKTTILDATKDALFQLGGMDAETAKTKLAEYNIPPKDVPVIVVQSYLSSYYVKITEQSVTNARSALGL